MTKKTQPIPLNETAPSEDACYGLSEAWRCKIDYVSISSPLLHVPPDPDIPFDPTPALEASLALRALGVFNPTLHAPLMWRVGAGRSGHKRSLYHSIGIVIFFGHPFNPPLIEIGGAGCDLINSTDELLPLVQRECDRITRLDLAGDLTCEVSPLTFVSAGVSSRYVSDGHANSATGQTQYIGSGKSDRHAKVYRYAPPHPRSDALRVEVTLHRELAKSAAQELCTRRISEVYAMACKPFSFKSPQWGLPTTDTLPRISLRSEPTSASRLRWLTQKIKPSVQQAHKDGLIDLRAWLAELS